MRVAALYNEIDPFAAQWIRNAQTAGLVTAGEVDERSIKDLAADDVAGPGQRHFFAGLGIWSVALRMAGVPDDADVWTGSCPCQPLSGAGLKLGFDDERHLWPAWFGLIRECRPAVLFGEQVASSLGWTWLDLVFADLEGSGYACAAADLPACGVGAPHQRQRIFFVAYAASRPSWIGVRGGQNTRDVGREPSRSSGQRDAANGTSGGLAYSELHDGPRRIAQSHGRSTLEPDRHRIAGQLGDASGPRGGRDAGAVPGEKAQGQGERQRARHLVDVPVAAGATRGFWSDAEWLLCRDGKARAVEPGAFPLATGARSRVGRLRAHGNAIVPQVAAEFIRAALEAA